MIHKEGYKVVLVTAAVLVLLNILIVLLLGTGWHFYALNLASVLLVVFILRFFRDPRRRAATGNGTVYAPADGKIVAVEETDEKEYFNDRRIQVSIFMSVWNVHVNWYPVAGKVLFTRYHPGKYLVAWHPKSSTLNEHTTCVIENGRGGRILVRQIAGTVARRIISYAREQTEVKLGDELGFIRFGSRVDLFLPPGSKILVSRGQKARGLQTPIAKI